VTSAEFDRAAIRLPVNPTLVNAFVKGNDITGNLQVPMLSMHTTGDGQVPIAQAQVLQRKIDAAGKRDLLVQRVVPDASHCGFTTPESEAGLEALVRWVEHGVKPAGTNVLVDDLRKLDRTYAVTPRPGSPEADAVPGAHDRVVVRGTATLDGAPFDARYLGAIVRSAGLVTPCQSSLPPITNGRFEITVLAAAEADGCGRPGAEIVLWAFANDKQVWSERAVGWPTSGHVVSFAATFSSATPRGTQRFTTEFSGELSRPDGHQLPPGTRIEAFVGHTRCGVASVQRTGNYAGFILSVVGPDSIAGCLRGATITFRVDDRPAAETRVNNGEGGSLDLTVS
jgi:hypothetical protein